MPPPASCGRTRKTSMRDVVNAIFYMAQSGCQWRMLPSDFPPFSTVQRYFYAWRDEGTWQTINHALLMEVREAAGDASDGDLHALRFRRGDASSCGLRPCGGLTARLPRRTCLPRSARCGVSDVPRPFDARRDQGGCWGGAQNHGINSSMRFCGQPFTRRVRRSVKYACGLT